MNFYFCETCGRRIIEQHVRDKKLKGVYCDDCAVNVTTMEFEAPTDPPASKFLSSAPITSRATKIRRAEPHAAATKPALEPVLQQPPPKCSISRPLLISGAAAIMAAMTFMAIFVSIGKSEPPLRKEVAIVMPPKSSATPSTAFVPVTQQAIASPADSIKNAIDLTAPAIFPSTRDPDESPAVLERAAQAAFDKATRFEGLEASDANGRIKRLEEFLARYPDAIVSARARIRIAELKTILTPKPSLPANIQSGQDVELFTGERPTLGWKFDNGKEFPGAKGTLALDSAIKHGEQESLRLSADFSGGGCYVQMGRDMSLLRLDPNLVSFWLRAPGLKSVTMRLSDATGQYHQLTRKLEPATEDWRQISFPIERLFAARSAGEALKESIRYEKWGGANDGKWHGPLIGLYIIADVTACNGKSANLWVAGLNAKAARQK